MPYLDLDPAAAAAAPVITDGAPIVSGYKTLLQLRTDLLSALGNRGDATPAMLNSWINDAYLLIASGIKFNESQGTYTFNTVVGQPFYKMPAAVQFTTGVSMADPTNYPFDGGVPLNKIDEQTYRRLPLLQDVPESYFRWNGMIVIYPTPAAVKAIVVEYRIRPVPLVQDTDSPILPNEWGRGLFLKAKSFAYADLEEADNAERTQNDYVRFLREVGSTESEEKTSQYAAFRRVDTLTRLNRYRPTTRQQEDW